METTELLKKVRKIEIKTRGLSRHIFSGHYHSAFKGRGMTFTEVREYQYGDDIRNVDWNVTARFNHPYVKVFEEERELTVMLLIDMSASHKFGTSLRHKKSLLTEIAAVLAFSAIQNNDKVGVIFFTDRIEKFIPPKKGSTHILRIIRELINFEPKGVNTNIELALKYLRNVIRKRSVAFLISDFFDEGFADALSIVNRKHDTVCIRTTDKRESSLVASGIMKFRDAESGETAWIDTSSKRIQEELTFWNKQHDKNLKQWFTRAGVDYTQISTNEDYVPPLMKLFRKRSSKQ